MWGEAGSGRSDGYGLAKIAKYHPEVLDKLDDLIQTLPIVKESPNRYQLENANYKASIRKDFESVKGNWVLTAFEKKESIARRSTDLPSTQWEAKKTTLANAENNPTTSPLKSQTQPPIEPKWKALNPKYKPKLSQQARQTLLENEKKKFYKEWAKYGGKPEDQFVKVPFKPEISRLIETPIQISQRTLYANPNIIKKLQNPYIIIKQADDYIIGDGFNHALIKPKEGHTIQYISQDAIENAIQKGAQVLYKDSKEFVVQKVEPKTQVVDVNNGKLTITNSNDPTPNPLTATERLNSPQDLKLPFVGESNRINESLGKNVEGYTYKLDKQSELLRQIAKNASHSSRSHQALEALMGIELPRQIARAYYNKDIGFIDLFTGNQNSGLIKIRQEANKNPMIQKQFKSIDENVNISDLRKANDKNNFLAHLINQALENGTLKKVNNITAVFETPYTHNNKVYKLQAQVKYTQHSDKLDTGRWVLDDFRCVE
ncbi:hypothetical protein [Helicobacter suis]|uniref:hypothetical protein n=1 Tax=Helicobacter suis TaxID=104628 RepID=UPI0013D1EDE2